MGLLIDTGMEKTKVCRKTCNRTDESDIVRECNMPLPSIMVQKNHDTLRLALSTNKNLSLSPTSAIRGSYDRVSDVDSP